jgi:hypothetical protein
VQLFFMVTATNFLLDITSLTNGGLNGGGIVSVPFSTYPVSWWPKKRVTFSGCRATRSKLCGIIVEHHQISNYNGPIIICRLSSPILSF